MRPEGVWPDQRNAHRGTGSAPRIVCGLPLRNDDTDDIFVNAGQLVSVAQHLPQTQPKLLLRHRPAGPGDRPESLGGCARADECIAITG
jgi:hypothetical protein